MNEFKQKIMNVQDSTALVKSNKGTVYPVTISDKIRLSNRTPSEGDTGIVHRVNGKYYLYDFESQDNDSYLSDVPLEDLGYDY